MPALSGATVSPDVRNQRRDDSHHGGEQHNIYII